MVDSGVVVTEDENAQRGASVSCLPISTRAEHHKLALLRRRQFAAASFPDYSATQRGALLCHGIADRLALVFGFSLTASMPYAAIPASSANLPEVADIPYCLFEPSQKYPEFNSPSLIYRHKPGH